jgi:hypothetical protein
MTPAQYATRRPKPPNKPQARINRLHLLMPLPPRFAKTSYSFAPTTMKISAP